MTYPTLTKEELASVTSGTSPNSLAHNIGVLQSFVGLPINTEPTIDPNMLDATPVDMLQCLRFVLSNSLEEIPKLNTRLCNPQPESSKDLLTDIGMLCSQLVVLGRTTGLAFGIPMDDVTEGYIGAITKDVDIKSVVKTLMFGVSDPRHPYEKISEVQP